MAEQTTKRPRTPRKRQAEIFAAAARIFHEKGYDATSIQDIADEVGLLKGSLYYYIESKDDLLYAILKDAHEQALENLKRTEDVEGDALTKIRAFVIAHITFSTENLVEMGVFFHDFRSLSAERQQEIVEARDAYERALRDLIVEGQREGVICVDIEPKLATIGILGLLNWIYHWYRAGGELHPLDVANEYANFVIAGLQCSPATHVKGHRSTLGAFSPEALGIAPGSNGRSNAAKKPRAR